MGTTTAEAQKIPTPKTLTRQEWLDGRKNYLGASEVAAALGLDKYTSPFTLWAKKRGDIEDKPETLPMKLGHLMEPVIEELYQDETGRTVYDPGDYAVYTHPEYDFLTCTPDRIILDDAFYGSPVEFKTMGEFSAKDYQGGGEGPLNHQVQLQAQIFVLEQDKGSLAALISNREFKTFDFDRHDKLLQNMLPRLAEFWECVQSGKEPKIDHHASTTQTLKYLHPDDNGETVFAGEAAQRWLDQFHDAKSQIKQLEALEAEAKNNLIALIGDATFIEGDGYRFSYKTQERKGNISVDPSLEGLLVSAGIPYRLTEPSKFRVLREVKRT